MNNAYIQYQALCNELPSATNNPPGSVAGFKPEKIFYVQYSTGRNNGQPVSEWPEYICCIAAETSKEARTEFNRRHQHLGVWLILDIFN